MSKIFTSPADGGQIAYTREGTGRTIVLLHPVGLDHTIWDRYVAAWRERYDVIAVDFRGHGASSLITQPISLSDLAADIDGIMAKEGVTGVVLAGVSMGGMVAQRVAIEHPQRVGALILCGTAGSFPEAVRPRIRARGDTGRAGSMREVADDTIARWFLPDSPAPDLVERCRKRLLADDWYSWSACWEAISTIDNLAELAGVHMPVLVVAGDADVSVPPAISRQIADAMPGAGFDIVAGGSHQGAFEAFGDYARVFETFLSGLN